MAPLRIFFSAYSMLVPFRRTNITAPDKPMPSCFTSSKSCSPRLELCINASRRWTRRWLGVVGEFALEEGRRPSDGTEGEGPPTSAAALQQAPMEAKRSGLRLERAFEAL